MKLTMLRGLPASGLYTSKRCDILGLCDSVYYAINYSLHEKKNQTKSFAELNVDKKGTQRFRLMPEATLCEGGG